jgi:hypothetical protein
MVLDEELLVLNVLQGGILREALTRNLVVSYFGWCVDDQDEALVCFVPI